TGFGPARAISASSGERALLGEIAVLPDGRAVVAFEAGPRTDRRAEVAVVGPGGAVVEPARRISEPGAPAFRPLLATGPGGRAVAV
ncbi:hypothetical protein OFM36_35725, partial [Escherichia coli]|nr:hypothetical protein [Escherichia coli]